MSGAPVLRDPGGERVLAPGDLVAWPSGHTGVHTVGGPGRFLIFSVGGWPGASLCIYPDSDKLGARPGDANGLDNLNFRRGDAIDYWAGEGTAVEPEVPQVLREPRSGESRPVVNVLSVAVTPLADQPPGFQMSRVRCAPLIGAEAMGASVYVIESGQGSASYHYEYGREEWALVLAGRPTLRHPDGTTELTAGDLVAFAEGPAGAHRFLNQAEETVRLMMCANVAFPATIVYPDSGEVGNWVAPGTGSSFRQADAVGYGDLGG